MEPVITTRGSGPIILGLPHTGTFLPPAVRAQLRPIAQTLSDTDWHVERLYADLLPNVTTVRATFHRYVIDANRDPAGISLYPGQNTTGLIPLTDFDGEALWNTSPSTNEIESRIRDFHAPYHAALAAEVTRVHALHGMAILYDCHSIRSKIPFLFDGTLPDFNVGDNEGRTCSAEIRRRVVEVCEQATAYSTTVNGRFKGGWTTRHYGQPGQGIHAIQMELAQSTYLHTQQPPFNYDTEKAEILRTVLRSILQSLNSLTSQCSS